MGFRVLINVAPGLCTAQTGCLPSSPLVPRSVQPTPLQLLLRLQVRSLWAQPWCRHQPPLAASPWRAAAAEKAALEAKIAPTVLWAHSREANTRV